MDLPTRLDLLAIARTYIRTRATKIDPNQIDVIGSDINLFVGSNMVVANEIVNQLAAAVSKLLVDGAYGEDLDRLAWDRYKLIRNAASPALATVEFSRVSVTAGAGIVPVGTRVQNTIGVDYTTTTQATFGATTLMATANVRSVQAGQLNRSNANTIVKIPEVSSLWDPSLRVTNPDATYGSSDRETDEYFKDRIKNYWPTVRRGTLLAIQEGAKAFAGVVSSSAVEEVTGGSTPARVVSLYVADGDGVGGPAMGIDLNEYRAAGIQVIMNYGLPQLVNIILSLTFQAGKQTQLLTEQIRTAIVGTVAKCTVNGTLYRAALLECLKSFGDDGLIYTDDSIVEPVGDLVPTVGRTIRTTLELVEVV